MAELTREDRDQILTWWLKQRAAWPSSRFPSEHLSEAGLESVERYEATVVALEARLVEIQEYVRFLELNLEGVLAAKASGIQEQESLRAFLNDALNKLTEAESLLKQFK